MEVFVYNFCLRDFLPSQFILDNFFFDAQIQTNQKHKNEEKVLNSF